MVRTTKDQTVAAAEDFWRAYPRSIEHRNYATWIQHCRPIVKAKSGKQKEKHRKTRANKHNPMPLGVYISR